MSVIYADHVWLAPFPVFPDHGEGMEVGSLTFGMMCYTIGHQHTKYHANI